jgi:arylsulfatase A
MAQGLAAVAAPACGKRKLNAPVQVKEGKKPAGRKVGSHRSDCYALSMLSRRAFIAAAAATAVSAYAADPPATPMKKPNVLFIMLDDLGSVDLNCYGSTDLVTPNLDRLAAEGVRFTQLYGAGPICSPSRAGLMTGQQPRRVGITGNVGSTPGSKGISTSTVLLPEMMKSAGYFTGHVGKWHLGYSHESMPMQRGFDTSMGNMGGCVDNYSHFFFWDGPNRHDLWLDGKEIHREGEYYGDLQVDHCKRVIDSAGEKPFFLYWAINLPHYPLQAKQKWRDHYQGRAEPRGMYAASVSTLDEMIGDVIGHLRTHQLLDDTIVIVQTDHGHSTEDRTFGGGGSAGPYRGAKYSLFEGGIRVVSVARWPAGIPAGSVRDQLATGCDWLPTIAEWTGAEIPHDHIIDGKSLAAVIRANVPTPHDEWHWQSGGQWVARQGDWKLIYHPRDTSVTANAKPMDSLFLANLAADISEKNNLADAHPDVVQHLKSLHEAWTRAVPEGNA